MVMHAEGLSNPKIPSLFRNYDTPQKCSLHPQSKALMRTALASVNLAQSVVVGHVRGLGYLHIQRINNLSMRKKQ